MGIEATIRTTSQILEQNISIPFYQRPYRWTTENVLQLLEDIQQSKAAGKLEYRIGSAIFYRSSSNQLEIVDGQQRLTTILLVANVAGKGDAQAESSLRYPANSVAAIQENYKFIKEWITANTNDEGMALVDYILTNCKFMEIIVDDLSEAFQMFDTQNGRGKSLEAYNLLKAYHIRAME